MEEAEKYNFKCVSNLLRVFSRDWAFGKVRRGKFLWKIKSNKKWKINKSFCVKSTERQRVLQEDKMSNNQQNHNGGASSNTSDQQTQGSQGKMLTQAEYQKYKQEDSNANNYYDFSKEATVLPVAWDGKFHYDPNNVYIRPNRNASATNNFYGFNSEPTVLPTAW